MIPPNTHGEEYTSSEPDENGYITHTSNSGTTLTLPVGQTPVFTDVTITTAGTTVNIDNGNGLWSNTLSITKQQTWQSEHKGELLEDVIETLHHRIKHLEDALADYGLLVHEEKEIDPDKTI